MTEEKTRETIRKILLPLRERHGKISEHYRQIYYRNVGFGVYDDEEEARKEKEHAVSVARAQGQMEAYEIAWQLICEAFGQDTVTHALEEGEKRIGNLPYTS